MVGGRTTEIRELADAAAAIFTRLGAKPFLARLDAALAHPPDRAGPGRGVEPVGLRDPIGTGTEAVDDPVGRTISR